MHILFSSGKDLYVIIRQIQQSFQLKQGSFIVEELGKDVSMIDLPIGCDIRFGKKCFLLGLGFDINYLYPRKSSNTTFPLFQIGVNANTGVGFVINRRWCLDVKYQVGYDISNLCSTEYQSFGYSYNETYLSINGIISVSLRYKFLKN